MKPKNLKVDQLATDPQLQIKKYLRKLEEGIDHQFDVWHFSKSIKTKLLKVSKKKACEELRLWIRSVCNHLWCSSATCEQNKMLLKEVYYFILKTNTTGQDMLFIISVPMQMKNAGGEERSKVCISPESESFLALQTIVLDKTILKDMVQLTKFSHTGILEVYHSVLNKWVP